MPVDWDLHFTISPRGDDGDAAAVFHVVPNSIRIIPSVSEENLWLRAVSAHHRQIAFIIGDLPASNFLSYWKTCGICTEMHFCRKATF